MLVRLHLTHGIPKDTPATDKFKEVLELDGTAEPEGR